MLVVVQLPVVDLTPLSRQTTRPIRAPQWGNPRLATPSQDFVRGIGAVVGRNTPAAPWQGESYYADARHSLRFESAVKARGLVPRFRRLFRENLTYRLDVGFAVGDQLRERARTEPWYLAEIGLQTKVRFSSSGSPPLQPLVHFGSTLSDQLRSAVFRSDIFGERPGRHLMTAAAPTVIIESRDATEESVPSFHQEWLSVDGRAVCGWLLTKTDISTVGQARFLRLHITRMSTDMALAQLLLAACENGSIDENSDAVQAALSKVAARLGRSESNGYPQAAAVRSIAERAREHYASQVDTLVRLHQQIASSPRNRALGYLAEHFSGGTLEYREGDTVVGDKYETHINGGQGHLVAVGPHATVTHTNGFPPEVAELVAALVRQVTQLQTELGEDASDAEDTAEGLSREAAKPMPDPDRLKRRLTRLRDIVTTLGPVGATVIDLVGKIMNLLPK